MTQRFVLIFLAVLTVFTLSVARSSGPQEDKGDVYQQMQLFGEVFERVRKGYVDEKSDAELVEAAINGMLSSLDPHSTFITLKDYEELKVDTSGKFGGLGIQVTMNEDGYVLVISPIDDTPAAKAGIKAQDLIISLDDEPVKGLTLDKAVDIMRGDVGTEITLSVVRGEEPPFDVRITREEIKLQSVRSEIKPGNLGYLRITSFNATTADLLAEEIAGLQEEADGPLEGYVLDLRNNPGGLLEASIAVADAFLGRVEVVSTHGRQENDVRRYSARNGELINGAPMVVLINGGSASASEIVAGALKDHQRALILGTDSFGKGSVQTVYELPGYGAMRMTTQRYYTPSGISIQAKGIEPDIYVEQSKVESLEVGRWRKEADLRGALDKPEGDIIQNEAAAEEEVLAGPIDDEIEEVQEEEFFDYQLERALDILRGYKLFTAQS